MSDPKQPPSNPPPEPPKKPVQMGFLEDNDPDEEVVYEPDSYDET